MTKIFAFKGSVFCGMFHIFGSIESWKSSFCVNNGFEESEIKILKLSEQDQDVYEISMQSPNASRVVFEDDIIKVISTQIVDDKEVSLITFIPEQEI